MCINPALREGGTSRTTICTLSVGGGRAPNAGWAGKVNGPQFLILKARHPATKVAGLAFSSVLVSVHTSCWKCPIVNQL